MFDLSRKNVIDPGEDQTAGGGALGLGGGGEAGDGGQDLTLWTDTNLTLLRLRTRKDLGPERQVPALQLCPLPPAPLQLLTLEPALETGKALTHFTPHCDGKPTPDEVKDHRSR